MKYLLIASMLFIGCAEKCDHETLYKEIREANKKYGDLKYDTVKLKEALAEQRYSVNVLEAWVTIAKLCRNEQISANILPDSTTITIKIRK